MQLWPRRMEFPDTYQASELRSHNFHGIVEYRSHSWGTRTSRRSELVRVATDCLILMITWKREYIFDVVVVKNDANCDALDVSKRRRVSVLVARALVFQTVQKSCFKVLHKKPFKTFFKKRDKKTFCVGVPRSRHTVCCIAAPSLIKELAMRNYRVCQLHECVFYFCKNKAFLLLYINLKPISETRSHNIGCPVITCVQLYHIFFHWHFLLLETPFLRFIAVRNATCYFLPHVLTASIYHPAYLDVSERHRCPLS